jgi:PEP-CTERM motif
MRSVLRTSAAIGFLAVGLSLSTNSAQADPILPGLTNLNFLSYSGSAPKNSFTAVNPVGWTGGTGLIFIDAPGTSSSDPNTACGSTYLTTAGCPSTLAIPGGYNYVEADGNPSYESGFNYLVTGLTVGQTYTLSFYQAASQQLGFGNGLNTTEQWIVSLGTSGMSFCNGCGAPDAYYGGNDSTYFNTDATASVMATPLMTTPSGGLTDWQFVSVSLTADSTTDLLSFLAWGDNGNTVNLPPMVFLAGVNSPSGLTTPEPGSLALFGTVLLGLGLDGARRRRRKAKV